MTQSIIRHRPSPLSIRGLRPARFKFLRSGVTFGDWAAAVSARGWFPPVDFVESDEGYHICAELPGLTKDDVRLELESQVLRISGERRREEPGNDATFCRSERGYGEFTRSFVLPKALLTEEIDATMRDGLLTVNIPKIPQARPQRISVH